MRKIKEAVRTEENRCSCGHWMGRHSSCGDCMECDDPACELRIAYRAFRDLFRRGIVSDAVYEMPEPRFFRLLPACPPDVR